jgi:hypothetical protein
MRATLSAFGVSREIESDKALLAHEREDMIELSHELPITCRPDQRLRLSPLCSIAKEGWGDPRRVFDALVF